MSRRRTNTSTCRLATHGKPCCFCGLSEDNELEYGKIYELGTIVTHYYCLLLSSMMQQRGRDDQGILGFLAADIEKELRRGKRLTCFHCKKIGATLGCCNTKCKRIFHLPCGLKAGSLHQFYSEFRSYCINHRPKQLIDGRILEEVKNAENTLCYICYDNVNYRDILAMLWAPCCKKNAFFHRKCVQQLANSSGYFFKCPLCNNKKEFQDAMLEHGIFIPSQDASWELVPNAFHELLYRHNQCDADTCVCPKGRNHSTSNTKWELVLCRMCGSQGIHRHCGHLKWANSSWECVECRSILDKSPIVNRQIHDSGRNIENGGPNLREVDSDSDLSVGLDANQLTEKNSEFESIPTVKVRPGPLSYKMKEVMKVAQSQPMTIDSSSSLEGTNSSTSLTGKENGVNKIVNDPNMVILLDSDEEPEDIEIISEKLNPKVLTTNDGTKIEILDKRGIGELAKSRNEANAESLNSAIPNLSHKDSKPSITSIQTVNSNMNSEKHNQIANSRDFKSQDSNSKSEIDKSGLRSTVNQNPAPNVNNQQGHRIISQGIWNPGSEMPQTFHQRIVDSHNSNVKVNPPPIFPNSQVSNQNSSQILNQRTSQNFSQQNITPQNYNPRGIALQNSNLRNTTPQISNSEITPPIISNTSNSTAVKNYSRSKKQTKTARKQIPSSVNQTPTPPNNLTTSGNNFNSGVPNPENRTPHPTNVPQFWPDVYIPYDDTLGIKITSVCSLPPDFFENLQTEVQDSKNAGTSASCSNSLKTEPSRDPNSKRKSEISGPSKRKKTSEQKTFSVSEDEKKKMEANIKSEELKGKEELKSVVFDTMNEEMKDKYPILKRNLVEEAMVKANITQNDIMNGEINVSNNQPSTSNLHTTVNNYVAMPSSNMTFYMGNGESQEVLKVAGEKAGGCQRNAGTSPTNFPRHGLSPINPSNKFGVRADDQIIAKADSRIGNNSFEDSKFSDLCCSNSEGCNELSENSSSCDSAGLIPDNVSLSDVKFRVCGSDIVQVILYDKYRIDIKMDNTGSRSPRDSDSSPLPCPSFQDDFEDSQDLDDEIPRKRIRDFEFEENTLQEFPATSKSTNITPDPPSTGVTTRERAAKAAKENLDPIKLSSDGTETRKRPSTPFANDFRILRSKRNSVKTRASTGIDTCLNCKVSIDLKKIWELVETKPHLFSKYDESLCKYKTHELKLTEVCKIKNKWLLVKSQSQDNFYGVSTRSRLLYKSKSMENLIAAKESGPQNKEETKNSPVTGTGLRRGLKRKCRYSIPVR